MRSIAGVGSKVSGGKCVYVKSFNSLTNIGDEATALRQEQETLPYDIRAEIDWIDFSCTANPLGTPQNITDAITQAIAQGDISFVPNSDGAHLRQMLGRFYEISPDAFLPGTSITAMIANIAQAYRPCTVGIPTPAPFEYWLAAVNAGHNTLNLPNPYALSAVDPQVAISNYGKFDGALLANPSYPCARLLSEEALLRYMDVCNWVVVDESHIDLTMGGESFVHLTQKYNNLLVIKSFSQYYGMPGIPLGYIVGHPETIAHIKQFCDTTPIGMFHEIVANEMPKINEFAEQTNEVLDAEIPWMQCMLSLTPGIKVFPSEANFVMCALEERASRDFGIKNAKDLIVRLQKAGFTVQDLQGTPGIEGNRYFLVSIRQHHENEKLISALRTIISSGA